MTEKGACRHPLSFEHCGLLLTAQLRVSHDLHGAVGLHFQVDEPGGRAASSRDLHVQHLTARPHGGDNAAVTRGIPQLRHVFGDAHRVEFSVSPRLCHASLFYPTLPECGDRRCSCGVAPRPGPTPTLSTFALPRLNGCSATNRYSQNFLESILPRRNHS